MAEGFGKLLGEGVVEVHSSGSRPCGRVNEKAVASMKEIGYDLTLHASKSLAEIPQIQYDFAITMGCGDECPHVQAKKREDWEIPDPKYMEMDRFNQIRDLIEKKVIDLIEILRPSEKPIEERR